MWKITDVFSLRCIDYYENQITRISEKYLKRALETSKRIQYNLYSQGINGYENFYVN